MSVFQNNGGSNGARLLVALDWQQSPVSMFYEHHRF